MKPIIKKAKEMLSNFCCWSFFGNPNTKNVGMGATDIANEDIYLNHLNRTYFSEAYKESSQIDSMSHN